MLSLHSSGSIDLKGLVKSIDSLYLVKINPSSSPTKREEDFKILPNRKQINELPGPTKSHHINDMRDWVRTMEIEIVEKTPDILKIKLEGSSAAFVNTLRRTILEEVPVLAIDECILIENTSVVFDEVLAHRLGLIPIKTDLELLVPSDECTCEGTGCPSCTTMLTLEKEGNAEGDTVTVYSGDLIPQNPSMGPVSEKIALAKLRKDQKIVLEAIAKVSRGKYHAKWQPVSTIAYKNIPIIEIDEEKCDGCGDCIQDCVKKVLEMKGDMVKIIDFYQCNMCKLCQESCDLDAIKVIPRQDAFIFWLEPTNALPAEEIVTRALDIIQGKLTELGDKIKVTS